MISDTMLTQIAFGAGVALLAAGAIKAIFRSSDIALAALILVGTGLILSPKLKTLTIGPQGGTAEFHQSIQNTAALSEEVKALAKSLDGILAQQASLAAQVSEIAKQTSAASSTAPQLDTIQRETDILKGRLGGNVDRLNEITRSTRDLLERSGVQVLP